MKHIEVKKIAKAINASDGAGVKLKRRIGKQINVHIGTKIPFENIKEIGNLIEITKFLRDSTYRLDPSNKNSIFN